MADTDSDWEQWGALDPYFGVYSENRFRGAVLSDPDRAAFFASGEAHVEAVFARLERAFPGSQLPRSAIDFGCGVGRLAIPFARLVERVWGVDVSPSMLAEAERNRVAAGCAGLVLAQSDDSPTLVSDRVDFVHSYSVFQHIPWARGRGLISTLAGKVSKGGLFSVQVLTAHRGARISRWMAEARYAVRPIHVLWNLLQGRPLRDPPMQMHVYDLGVLLEDLRDLGFNVRHESEQWKDVDSTTIVARRDRDA